MALPLPKVVPDIAPGGGIVTAMGGINALNNAMYEAEYNKQKAKFAPYSIGAQAMSQMAYANLLAPQMMAKVMNNENLLAGMTEDQKRAALQGLYRAGSGQGTGNAILNMPGMPGMQGIQDAFQPEKRFSFTNFLQDMFRKKISPEEQQVNALVAPTQPQVQSNPMNSMNVPSPQASINNNAVQGGSNPVVDQEELNNAYNQWMNTPEGKRELAKGENANIPDENEMRAMIASGNAEDQRTLAQKAGEFAATKKQLETLGGHRGDAIRDIGEQQIMLSATGGNLNTLIDDFTNPEFIALRSKFPVLQDLQLKAAAHFKDPMVQNMVGKIIADLESFKSATIMGFKGQTLKREFDFADKLKPSEKDTVYTALGKLQSLKALHDIAEKKNALISKYIQQDEMNVPEAIARANKAVDIRNIQNQVRQLTQPLHKIKNSKTGETIYLTPDRFKEEGFTTEQGMSRTPASLETGKSNVNIR